MLLNLKPEDLACFRRLFIEGAAKCEAAELLDRGWAHYCDDHGTLALTADGIQIATMIGLRCDGGAAAADSEATSAPPARA